ncbi:MAG: penicillin-binding transpeptidase domain-containing protein [Pyrinomonadaceae bacterium]
MTTLVIFLFQTPTPLQPATTPEKLPAWLTLIYLSGIALVGLLLIISLVRTWFRRPPAAPTAPASLPKDIQKRLGATTTNRGLRAWRWVFALAAIFVFSFHVYWARYAAEGNPKFQEMTYKDLRNRRLSESTLRGWIYDRKGRPLAFYRKNSGGIDREYPMDTALAHIFGTDRGEPGLERALFGTESGSVPEVWQIIKGQTVEQKLNKDYTVTIDQDLQQAVVDQLKGNHGAVVVFNPQTGDVLAMYSNPSYSLKQVQDDESAWIKLDNDRKEKPLLNRALNEYYVPGSTFKTLMMYTAFRNGMQNTRFNTSGGFSPPGCGRTITDDNGGCEACGDIGIDSAYQHSSNIYFSYLGTQLGGVKIRDTAKLVGLGAYDSVSGETQGRREPEIWNASSKAIQNAIAPTESWLKAGPHSTRCELMYEGYGQGYASQMTPFQMAMMISVAANLEGRLMKPKIEMNRAAEMFSQVLTRDQAAQIRHIMNLVTEGGTAAGAMRPVLAAGIRSGGKTGTAQKAVPIIDPKTGEPQKKWVTEKDPKGNIIGQHQETVFADKLRSDAWYLSFAPLDNPAIAMAVLLEGPGPGISFYGGKNAAPIAAQLILKAKALGYFGGPGNQTGAQPGQQPTPGRRNR